MSEACLEKTYYRLDHRTSEPSPLILPVVVIFKSRTSIHHPLELSKPLFLCGEEKSRETPGKIFDGLKS